MDRPIKSPPWKLSLKLLLHRSAAALAGFLCASLLADIAKDRAQDWAFDLVSALAGCLYFLYMGYRTAEHSGRKDYNWVKYDHIPKDLGKGLKAGLLAEIPFLLFWLMALPFFHWAGRDTPVVWAFFLCNIHFGWLENVTGDLWLFWLPMALTAGVGWIGYRNGYKQIDLFYKLTRKSRK